MSEKSCINSHFQVVLPVNPAARAWITRYCALPVDFVCYGFSSHWTEGGREAFTFLSFVCRPRDLMGGILLVYRVIVIGQYSIL